MMCCLPERRLIVFVFSAGKNLAELGIVNLFSNTNVNMFVVLINNIISLVKFLSNHIKVTYGKL